MPPVSTLLEAATPPPPAAPESPTFDSQEYEVRERAHLDNRAATRNTRARPRWWIQRVNRTQYARHNQDSVQWTRSPSPFGQADTAALQARRRASTRDTHPRQELPVILPLPSSQRPHSRHGPLPPNGSALPTPPHDASEDQETLFMPDREDTASELTSRPSHPLSRSWRPG